MSVSVRYDHINYNQTGKSPIDFSSDLNESKGNNFLDIMKPEKVMVHWNGLFYFFNFDNII